jgi:hypothetical protein
MPAGNSCSSSCSAFITLNRSGWLVYVTIGLIIQLELAINMPEKHHVE